MERSPGRALQVQEVLSHILSFAVAGSSRQQGLPTVSAMALTCRFFTAPALDIMWADQHSLAPLFRFIPACVWESIEKQENVSELVSFFLLSQGQSPELVSSCERYPRWSGRGLISMLGTLRSCDSRPLSQGFIGVSRPFWQCMPG
jgi:hypothetical protein